MEKRNYSSVGLIRTIEKEGVQHPIWGFMTYTWSYPSQWQTGKFKSGFHWNPNDDGTHRMWEAVNASKTAISEMPFSISEGLQIWSVPDELVDGDKAKAAKIAKQFDAACNKALKKYRVQSIGKEWYSITIQDLKKLREDVWAKVIGKASQEDVNPGKPILPRGLQQEAINNLIDFLESNITRAKGVAPTGFGKTATAFLFLVEALKKNLLPNRLVIMTAPTQHLALKNRNANRNYANRNGIEGIVNLAIYSGSDLGLSPESETQAQSREEQIASIVLGYLNDPSVKLIVLHVCNPSVEMLDRVLDAAGIAQVDFAICDEAHTLASHKDNRRNYILKDGNVNINKRFFLTATEKILVNPDDLDEKMVNNFMDNPEIYGDYIFKYSFAAGVNAKHIVPFIAKLFECSISRHDLNEFRGAKISYEIEELIGLYDNTVYRENVIRSIASIRNIMVKEDRNKLLVICSRNSHAKILFDILNFLKKVGNLNQDIEVHEILACEYSPAEREEALNDIDEANGKHIIITGPWSITGIDCPSIDSIFWNFIPGNEISATQGIGRGTRILEGKQDVLVSFNMDLDGSGNEIKNTIFRTLVILHEKMFPKHEVKVAKANRRRIGGRFLSVEKDNEAIIHPEIRTSLNKIYENTNVIDLANYIKEAGLNFNIYDLRRSDESNLVKEYCQEVKTNTFKDVPSLQRLLKEKYGEAGEIHWRKFYNEGYKLDHKLHFVSGWEFDYSDLCDSFERTYPDKDLVYVSYEIRKDVMETNLGIDRGAFDVTYVAKEQSFRWPNLVKQLNERGYKIYSELEMPVQYPWIIKKIIDKVTPITKELSLEKSLEVSEKVAKEIFFKGIFKKRVMLHIERELKTM